MHIPGHYNTVKEKYKSLLMKKANVVGIAIGKKIRDGKETNRPCIVILVKKKLPLHQLKAQDIIPKALNSIETDVQESGTFKAFLDPIRTSRMRPAYGGISIGHKNITAGTLGCLVYKNKEPYILSNNHVLANSNGALIGDAILQPGPLDGGTGLDRVATLHSFVKLSFATQESSCPIAQTALSFMNTTTHILRPYYQWFLQKQTVSANAIDAALAKPLRVQDVSREIVDLGKPKGIADAAVDLSITKSGRTTGATTGKINMLNATVEVVYQGKKALFENQIITSPMSAPGDSGSLVMDMKNNAMGILFAGSDQFTLMNPVKAVLAILGATLTP